MRSTPRTDLLYEALEVRQTHPRCFPTCLLTHSRHPNTPGALPTLTLSRRHLLAVVMVMEISG
jgi:hypothetical protein